MEYVFFLCSRNHSDFSVPAIDDGLLEVFCVYSSFHIAQMQVR